MADVDGDYCSDCKTITQVVHDQSTGDSICQECGLVLESRIVDETAEWRTFANDERDGRDPIRVGASSNPFLDREQTYIETTIVNIKNQGQRGLQIPRAALASTAADKCHKSLVQAFATIDEVCERLCVNKTVKDLACDRYSQVCNLITDTTRHHIGLVAACVFCACREMNQSRTLKEMQMTTSVQRKKIANLNESIRRVLVKDQKVTAAALSSVERGTDQHVINDYVKRFGYGVNLNNQAIKAAQEILKNSEELDIRRTPKSIAAGIIYITCLLCGHKRTARDISVVADTSEGTIKKSYKDLYPYLKLIVPDWFASESVVMKLLHAP